MGEEAGILLIGYRSSNELVLLEEVGIAGKDVRISTDDGTAGHHGFVTDLLERYMDLPDVDPSAIFACGPIPMLKKVASMAGEKNIPCHVSLEAVMACGIGACQGCAVKAGSREKSPYFHVCKDGPVFDARGLDWDQL
jgi:dihydroorotate dehydrogenase electron transfer subunit